MAPKGLRLRGVYGKPWSKLAKNIPMSRKVLQQVGEILVESIQAEAQKDLARSSGGKPPGVNNVVTFLKSLEYRILGKSTIEVYSTWPYVEQVIAGRVGGPMKWLTQEAQGLTQTVNGEVKLKPSTRQGNKFKRRQEGGPIIVPIIDNGRVIFRFAPLQTKDAWIHPGIARHTFIERGIRKGRQKAAKIIGEEAVRQLLMGDPTR